MIQKVKTLFLFYQKIMLPTLTLSLTLGLLGLGLTGNFSFTSVGIWYFVFGVLSHYFIYEVKNPNEYFFYHNLGWSKLKLWCSVTLLHVSISLIFFLL